MKSKIRVEEFKDEYVTELRCVFYSSVHENAKEYYSQKQLDAWAPIDYDCVAWAERIHKIRPFIACDADMVVGYADVQSDGYIDHFFVRGGYSGLGIGTALMEKIIEVAKTNGFRRLYSEVSLAAQKFFEMNGFNVLKRQIVEKREAKIENAIMERLGPWD